MAAFRGLLGDKLQTKDGEADVEKALQGKGAVALYFSAHWCPPCRGFTPQLAEWYTSSLKAKGLEVVFVSSDRDEDAFKSYYGEQPWLALPYNEREKKDALSKKFKVQGIPSLVILSGDAQVITKDGRSAISSDPTGEEFPWVPKSLSEILTGSKILGQNGAVLGSEALAGKVFAIYFSAHWCPPCRGFTPKLAEWYKKSLKAKGLEVLFVSSDRDEGAFKEYFGEQPWLALDWQDRKRKDQLSNLFGVNGIPSLVIIDADGSTVTKDGRAAVSSDPEGEEFPWHPKPVHNLAGGPGSIQEVPTIIAFCETSDKATQQAIEAAMSPAAQTKLDEAKAAGEEEPAAGFAMAKGAGGIAERLRQMFKLQELPPGKHEHPLEKQEHNAEVSLPPKLMLLDIPDEGGYYEGPEGEITAEVVNKFFADYTAKALTRKQLERG